MIKEALSNIITKKEIYIDNLMLLKIDIDSIYSQILSNLESNKSLKIDFITEYDWLCLCNHFHYGLDEDNEYILNDVFKVLNDIILVI
jgi:hypothetical protein